MNETATWTTGVSGERPMDKPLDRRLIVLVLALVLVLGLSGGALLYSQETLSLSKLISQFNVSGKDVTPTFNSLHTLHRWSLWALIGTAAGGAGFLVAILTGFANTKQSWGRRLQAAESEWKCRQAELQNQIAELRRDYQSAEEAKTESEERAKGLTASNTALQEEINKRNRSEKALTQKRQELESSKSVLELHVQARTQELQRLQHRYKMILNSAGEGICGLDADGKATFVNPAVARLTGWQIDELIGKTEQEIFHPNDLKGHAHGEERDASDQVFHRKDGSSFSVECVKTAINEDGREVGSVLVFKDTTDRRQAERTLSQRAAELARSNAELEQFAFVASHDLQEPLRKIQAFGDRLKLKCEGILGPEAQDYLDRMQNASARMRTLISDLLAFSRAIRSTEPFVPVDLAAITREVLGDLEVRIEKSGARVDVGELPTIEADPMQMRQLLLNLIGNALKFQPAKGNPVVKIQSRVFHTVAGEELCELSVIDNGIGFDEKYLDKIFAVFQRLHGRNEYEGTGVGLAVCRRIVDRHHGSINAHSKLGKGATFIVTLPVHQAKATSPS